MVIGLLFNFTSSGWHMTNHALLRARLKLLAWLLGSLGLSSAGAAHACTCASISPTQGFTRAEYVFSGTVVEEAGHTWTVDVDRVWKGADKLAPASGCWTSTTESIASSTSNQVVPISSSRSWPRAAATPITNPVCNWTRALRSTWVSSPRGPVWLEDAIVDDHGPGGPPKAEDPWNRLPERHGGAGN
jgi:hypothetical protein